MANHYEDDESQVLWQWAQHLPILRDYLYHIPNGGNRNVREALRLKKQGVRAGVSDYHLPVARGGYNGLWVEFKAAPPNNAAVQKNQKEWLTKMADEGYAVYVCKGLDEAIKVFNWYLALPVPSKHIFSCPSIDEITG